jgi:hypothetical protein
VSFLKPKPQTSTSENINNKLITDAYGGQMQQGTGATNFLSSLLTGQGNTSAANAGYQGYLQNAGYAPAMRQMSQAVTGQGAAAGLLNSGSTTKALQTRGAEINQGFFNNYLQQLAGLSGLGLQAGGLVANTGQKSTGTGASPSTAGSIASTIGGIASIFSDRRLKHAIRKVGEYADGLGIYIYSYLGSNERIKGVMADEVAKLRPWALGPKVGSFQTVNYGAL